MPDDKKEPTVAVPSTETAAPPAAETEATEESAEKLTPEQALAKMTDMAAALKRANRESAERRKKLDALEEAEKKRKEAELTEAQKWEAKAKEYEAKLSRYESEMQAGRLRLAVVTAAATLNFISTDEAYKLADLKLVTFGDDGEPDKDAVKVALDALAKKSPYLLKGQPKPADIGATQGRAGSPTGSGFTEEEIRAKFHLR
jgi:hypothetical protein